MYQSFTPSFIDASNFYTKNLYNLSMILGITIGFPHWNKWNSTSPLELLLLGALSYIGHGWTFDDLEESTLISAEVHRNLLH